VLLHKNTVLVLFVSGLSSQTKSNVNNLFFWSTLVACPGESMTLRTINLALSKLTSAKLIGVCQRQILLSCMTKLAFVRGDLCHPLLDFIKEPLPHRVTTLEASKMLFDTHLGFCSKPDSQTFKFPCQLTNIR